MFKFEDKTFTGPLAEFLENCKPHRVEAIYNTDYRYIKEIIYDTEAEERYGRSRAGYEQYGLENPGSMSFSGEIDLRIRTDIDGNVLGCMTETKRTNNDNFTHMVKQYDDAKAELIKLLDVKDIENFNYWLEEAAPFRVSTRMGANETISAIEDLELIYETYNEDEDFKKFLDKIKG
jgi:hypothetical protein